MGSGVVQLFKVNGTLIKHCEIAKNWIYRSGVTQLK